MARNLSSGMNTAVAAERATVVRLIQLEHGGGTVRWATSAQDLSWGGNTWAAIGGRLLVGSIQEADDVRGSGLPVELPGVDSVITAVVLTNAFRGHEVLVYRAHLGADGQIVADPHLEFRGYQNGDYRIADDPNAEAGGGGTVTIKSRWVSRLARLQRALAVRTNLHSHRDFLRRGGLVGGALADDIFRFLPGLAAKINLIYWGGPMPARFSGHSSTGVDLGRERYGGRHPIAQ